MRAATVPEAARHILTLTGPQEVTLAKFLGPYDRMLGRPPPRSVPAAPASLLRAHPRLTILCDADAASSLRARSAAGDRAVIVLGHRDPAVSAAHRISDESRQRIERAVRGDIRRVTVVTSTWHVRTPCFLAPGGASGLHPSFARDPRGLWTRPVVAELGALRHARGRPRRATAAMRLSGPAGPREAP